MKAVHLIVVGKLKDKHFEKIEADFVQRIKSVDFHIHEVKANAENPPLEAKALIKKIDDLTKGSSARIFALTEHGKERESIGFSQWLYDRLENHHQLIFLIAGAQGFDSQVLKMCHERISLSKLTFAHKLARLLFIEQLYRAITIKENHPYHN